MLKKIAYLSSLLGLTFVTAAYVSKSTLAVGDFILLGSTEYVGEWQDPLPQRILIGENADAILMAPANSVSGSVTYGVLDYCQTGTCDAKYKFVITVVDGTCRVTAGSRVSATVASSEVEDGLLQCRVNAAYVPLPPSPTMRVIINNQLGRTPGTGEYTFGLINGSTSVEQGFFEQQPLPIAVDKSAEMVLSADGGTNSQYQGILTYDIDDFEIEGAPPSLHIGLYNDPETDISNWCDVGIDGDAQGLRRYQYTVYASGTRENAVCEIDLTSTDNTEHPANYEFVIKDRDIPSEKVSQLEYFKIGSQHYLAVANEGSTTTRYIKNNVFKFDSSTEKFSRTPLKNLLVGYLCADDNRLRDHGIGWRHVNAGGKDWLIMANNYSYYRNSQTYQCDTRQNPQTTSFAYEWTGSDFNNGCNPCKSLNTIGALMMESYTVKDSAAVNQTYVAVVEKSEDADARKAAIYKWNGSDFVYMSQNAAILAANLSTVTSAESFTVDGKSYLVFSQSDADTVVFSIDANGVLSLHQGRYATPNNVINEQGSIKKSLVFYDGKDYFLVSAYTTNTNISPRIYQWDRTKKLFVPTQQTTLPQSFAHAQDWIFYTVNNQSYLAVALGANGVTAYRWNQETQQLDTRHAFPVWSSTDDHFISALAQFSANNTVYIVVGVQSLYGNTATLSYLMKWQEKD